MKFTVDTEKKEIIFNSPTPFYEIQRIMMGIKSMNAAYHDVERWSITYSYLQQEQQVQKGEEKVSFEKPEQPLFNFSTFEDESKEDSPPKPKIFS
jgi:hypothetical protein